jgi:hypothetical protein
MRSQMIKAIRSTLLFFARDTPGRKHDVYWVDAATVPALRSLTDL